MAPRCGSLRTMLELTPDERPITACTVRKRLDLTRPVPRAVIEECPAFGP